MSGVFLRSLADVSIRASLAAILVAGALALIRVRTSAVRHASWTAVLLAMLLMPALTRSLPSIAVPLSLPAPHLPSSLGVDDGEVAPEPLGTASTDQPLVRADRQSGMEAAVRAPASAPVDPPSKRSFWPVAGLAVYGLGAGAMSIRFLIGWSGAARFQAR